MAVYSLDVVCRKCDVLTPELRDAAITAAEEGMSILNNKNQIMVV
jgi:hypothetical protein